MLYLARRKMPALFGGAAPLTPWYLSGGISASNVVAAYQPKGASSLAASYVNLANPGTYDLTEGVAPTFSAATGWTFNGSSQYLITGITPASRNWSYLVQFTNGAAATGVIFGCHNSGTGNDVSIHPYADGFNRVKYYNTNSDIKAPALTGGNLGMAGAKAFRNGVSEGITLPGTGLPALQIFVGSWNYDGSPLAYYANKTVAMAVYNTVLSDAQMLAVAAAMAAL